MTTDDNGDIDGSVTIPDTTTPGGHSIDITGENQAGEPTDVTQPVYIPENDNDYDGDGLPNASDSCPTAINSGIDSDQDGIDDICDPLIVQPPADPGTGQGSPAPSNNGNSTPESGTGSFPDQGTPNTPAPPPTPTSTQTSTPSVIAASNLSTKLQPAILNTFGHVLGASVSKAMAQKLNPVSKLNQSKLGLAAPKQIPRLDLPTFSWRPWLWLTILFWMFIATAIQLTKILLNKNKYQSV